MPNVEVLRLPTRVSGQNPPTALYLFSLLFSFHPNYHPFPLSQCIERNELAGLDHGGHVPLTHKESWMGNTKKMAVTGNIESARRFFFLLCQFDDTNL